MLASINREVIGLRGHSREDAAMILTVPRSPSAAGALLRDWRLRRRLSQLDCALDAEISQKHLSFIESGRARPSREMVLHLTERLGVPLRERNAIMLAAGYAPAFPERDLSDPALAAARAAIAAILKGHEPYPALAFDRRWNLIDANAGVARLLTLVTDPSLLQPPVNVLRLSFAPGGLAPHIVNLDQWRGHILERLRQQIGATGDRELVALRDALARLAGPGAPIDDAPPGVAASVAIPLRLRMPAGELSLISATTIFGTPVDVTLSELALETFFPADERTAAALRALASQD
jgi:transcriptional regulator with XRE-family HTH domain